MGLNTLQITIGSGLGGLVLMQSALLFYQFRKLKQYKSHAERLSEELAKSRKLDEVTGAWNYPFFVKAANAVVKKARVRKRPVSMLLVDVDGLEKINLRHSFQGGNAVLVHLYRRLKKILPANAVIGRFGGSGFFVLLDGYSEERMLDLLEELHRKLDKDVCKMHHKSIPFDISMAAVTLHGKQVMLTTMLEQVEEGLEAVKRQRKNYGLADRSGKLMKVA